MRGRGLRSGRRAIRSRGQRAPRRGARLAGGLAAAAAIAFALVSSPGWSAAETEARSDRSASASTDPLRIAAAASLTEVVEDLAARFPDGPVVASFGASSDLARQIRDGAPADVFLSASREWVEFLVEAGQVLGAPVVVARNVLVCIAPRTAAAAAPGAAAATAAGAANGAAGDPRALAAQVAASGDLVAIADEGVPAGEYARRALAALGLEASYARLLVGQKDVRAVLHAVEQGEVAAGFVYATDAKLAEVEVLFAFEPATHPPIEYQAVVAAQTANPELARRFLAYLSGEVARARLSAAGFVLP